ncbi:MAG: FAD:protein FMN transferase [Candidatus Latescibacteria bacterium]|nr:FAD:protein FMN transferase [Candidatus Latescibacterota bacterium]
MSLSKYLLKGMCKAVEIMSDKRFGFFKYIRGKYSAVWGIPLILLAVWLFTGGWFFNNPKLISATKFLMDTSVTVKIFVKNDSQGEVILKKAFDEAARIERIMEPLKGGGELQRINASPANSRRTVSPELRQVLERSQYFYNLTDGAFDPTIAPVKWLWDFESDRKVPDKREISEKLKSVHFSSVKIDDGSIIFTDPEVKLDLGGVAKGFIIDRMVAVLKDNGIKAGLVNAGGDIYSFGKKPGDNDWVIGISHPRLSQTIRPHKTIQFAAVATSGDYQRFFIVDGVRYHHILDPSTGCPAWDCISVTVWTDTAMDADILATSLFVMGPKRGLALAESLEHVETLIFYENEGSVEAVMTSGIRGKVQL